MVDLMTIDDMHSISKLYAQKTNLREVIEEDHTVRRWLCMVQLHMGIFLLHST